MKRYLLTLAVVLGFVFIMASQSVAHHEHDGECVIKDSIKVCPF